MNSSRGIFEPQEGFAPAPPAKSPFAVADDGPGASPFAVLSEPESPFASMKDEPPARPATSPTKLPERRPAGGDMPSAEVRSPFAAESTPVSPFESAAAPSSPFGATPPPVPAAASAPSPFGFAQEAPAAAPATTAPVSTPVAPPPVAAAPAAESDAFESDSRSIRQLELRAIFGVDRELGAEEMLQRARGLSGIRHVARVPAGENATIDALKRVVGSLDFPAGQVKLVCGNVPIEFIREGNVILAVQNDGSFAPGVRETLMIVARELGRL